MRCKQVRLWRKSWARARRAKTWRRTIRTRPASWTRTGPISRATPALKEFILILRWKTVLCDFLVFLGKCWTEKKCNTPHRIYHQTSARLLGMILALYSVARLVLVVSKTLIVIRIPNGSPKANCTTASAVRIHGDPRVVSKAPTSSAKKSNFTIRICWSSLLDSILCQMIPPRSRSHFRSPQRNRTFPASSNNMLNHFKSWATSHIKSWIFRTWILNPRLVRITWISYD